ncbi:hypothetical protein Tco_1563718 [Tanacetum coccineum]
MDEMIVKEGHRIRMVMFVVSVESSAMMMDGSSGDGDRGEGFYLTGVEINAEFKFFLGSISYIVDELQQGNEDVVFRNIDQANKDVVFGNNAQDVDE